MVEDDNEPAPNNVLNYEGALIAPKTLNFGFQGINPWIQSSNLPVGKVQLNKVSNIRVQHMS